MKNFKSFFLFIVFIFLSTMVMSQNIPFYVPSDTLLSWWSYSGNALDESGNGNNGTVTGAVLTTDRFGFPNSAYQFTFNSKIRNCKNDTLYKNSFSYSFWVEPTQTLVLPNEGDSSNTLYIERQCVIHPNHGMMYGSYLTNAGSGVYVGTNGVVVIEHSHNYLKRALVYSDTLNGWHHIVIVYNNKIPSLYIDGQFIKNGVLSSKNVHPSLGYDSTIITSHNFSNSGIGVGLNDQYNDGHYFYGKIDDIGIWGKSLTLKEIIELYNGCINVTINSQPTNQSAFINNSTQFVVSSPDTNVTYQWQTNVGLGFQNITDLGQYSGSTNDTLTISNLTLANNNQLFRCIVGMNNCPDTSDVVTLTVIDNQGISDQIQNKISIYPNPTEGTIYVKVENSLIGTDYVIFDNIGKIILKGTIQSESTVIDLDAFSNGLYLFRIENSYKNTFKVMKN